MTNAYSVLENPQVTIAKMFASAQTCLPDLNIIA